MVVLGSTWLDAELSRTLRPRKKTTGNDVDDDEPHAPRFETAVTILHNILESDVVRSDAIGNGLGTLVEDSM